MATLSPTSVKAREIIFNSCELKKITFIPYNETVPAEIMNVYKKGKHTFKAPPVYSSKWDTHAWINYLLGEGGSLEIDGWYVDYFEYSPNTETYWAECFQIRETFQGTKSLGTTKISKSIELK